MTAGRKFALRGVCIAEVSGACPEALLNACAINGLELWSMECVDRCTLHFCFYEKNRDELCALAEKSMCDVKVQTLSGGSRLYDFVKRHLGLAVTLLSALALLSFSTMFIWDMQVYGNEKLSDGEILRALSKCGVDCGTFWPTVDKELLRSNMLLELPELAWMTVNIRASSAEVLVSERQEKPEIYEESDSADLIAGKTGIIKHVFARNGKVLAQPGSSVVKGEVLISGCMDSITAQPRYVRSQGEVMAETWQEICSVNPIQKEIKTAYKRPQRRVAVKFGQRRLNFYFGGRKTVDGCDKIIDNYIIGIKGAFTLPISLVVEKYILYETQLQSISEYEEMAGRLSDELERRAEGEILSQSITGATRNGLELATLRAACLENIAVLREHIKPEDKMP